LPNAIHSLPNTEARKSPSATKAANGVRRAFPALRKAFGSEGGGRKGSHAAPSACTGWGLRWLPISRALGLLRFGMTDRSPPEKRPRERPETVARSVALAPIAPDVAAALVAGADKPELMKALLVEYAADPQRTMAALEEYHLRLTEYERLRGEIATAALELHQRAVIPARARQPAPGAMAPGELAKVLSTNVRMARLEQRLSQRDLERLSGISQTHISKIESGSGNVTLETLEALAKCLGRSPIEMLIPRTRT
jgi:DNA-binding XRE family transcriptional regulator